MCKTLLLEMGRCFHIIFFILFKCHEKLLAVCVVLEGDSSQEADREQLCPFLLGLF